MQQRTSTQRNATTGTRMTVMDVPARARWKRDIIVLVVIALPKTFAAMKISPCGSEEMDTRLARPPRGLEV